MAQNKVREEYKQLNESSGAKSILRGTPNSGTDAMNSGLLNSDII